MWLKSVFRFEKNLENKWWNLLAFLASTFNCWWWIAKGVHTELLFCLWWLILCQSWEKIYSLVSFAFLKLLSVPVIYSKIWKCCCLLHIEYVECLFFGTGRKGENTSTKTLTQKVGSISHLPFALMKYIQLSYEDMVCDDSWKEGVDKASHISWADKELVIQKMKQCWWKALPYDARKQWEKRRVQAGRNTVYPSFFSLEHTVIMYLFFNAGTKRLSRLQGQNRFLYILPFQFSSVLPAQEARFEHFRASTKCSALAFLFPLWVP